MKLSNKILVGFFGFIFIYLTAVFAEIRFSGTPNFIDDTNSIAETVDFSGVTFIILQDLDQHVNIVGSNESQLEVRSLSGGLLEKFNYKISGDTLILSQLQPAETRAIKITVFVPKGTLKAITLNEARASVAGLKQRVLRVSQKAGRIWMSESNIEKIQIDASDNSYLQISDTDLDTLSATIDLSELYVASPVDLLEGSMKNKSLLRVREVNEIQFKKDESSQLNLY